MITRYCSGSGPTGTSPRPPVADLDPREAPDTQQLRRRLQQVLQAAGDLAGMTASVYVAPGSGHSSTSCTFDGTLIVLFNTVSIASFVAVRRVAACARPEVSPRVAPRPALRAGAPGLQPRGGAGGRR